MAAITINIPDAVTPRVLNAVASYYGYTPMVEDANGGAVTNPETKAQFAKRMIQQHLMTIVRSEEVRLAQQEARATAEQSVASSITLS